MNFGLNQITNRIWLGGEFQSPADVAMLKGLGITNILNCTEFAEPDYVSAAFTICQPQPAKADDGTKRGLDWFKMAGKFWLPMALDPSKKIYTHCAWGLERSHAMVIYQLMLLGLDLTDAFMLVMRHRPSDVIGVRYLAEAKAAAEAAL